MIGWLICSIKSTKKYLKDMPVSKENRLLKKKLDIYETEEKILNAR